MKVTKLNDVNDLVGFCKRRGFLFQSSEIYGGLGGVWDYGPLGVELKRQIQDSWWKSMVNRRDIVGLDSSILMNPEIWKASGHVENFHDPMVDCRDCKFRFREDHIKDDKCPNCGKSNLTEPKDFNLMFKTFLGATELKNQEIYLRPETAQGIYVNFVNVQTSMRQKLPFGIAQVGKAFRNEITPGNFIFRTREFEQMEMQYFVKPGQGKEVLKEWLERRFAWYESLGFEKESLKITEHEKLAHYAEEAFDIEYKFPFGLGEIEGIHARTDFDLKRHQEFSKKNMQYTDQSDGNKKFVPHVVETSAGLGRCFLAVMCNAYNVEELENGDNRVVMKFPHKLAPVQVAVLPLMKKDGLLELTNEIFDNLCTDFRVEYDDSGSIGKRYRRQDEIGTPFCVTVDYQTLEDSTVTVRDRDSLKQERVNISELQTYFKRSF